MKYDNSGCAFKVSEDDRASGDAITSMAETGVRIGIFNDSECLTKEDKDLYRYAYKKAGGIVKVGISNRKRILGF